MKKYKLFKFIISTDIDFDKYLYQHENNDQSEEFKVLYQQDIIINKNQKFQIVHTRRDLNGDLFFRIEKEKFNYLITVFEEGGNRIFYIDTDKMTIYVKTPIDDMFYALFFSIISSKLLYLNKCLQLHGNAIKYNGKNIALLGKSGAGKSTISAQLILEDAQLISDDIISIDRKNNFFIPGPPGIRVFHDSPLLFKELPYMKEEDKIRVNLKDSLYYYNKKDKIDIFFIIEIDEKVANIQIEKNNSVECFKNIFEFIYAKYNIDKDEFTDIGKQIINLLQQVKVYKIVRPKMSNPTDIVRIIHNVTYLEQG